MHVGVGPPGGDTGGGRPLGRPRLSRACSRYRAVRRTRLHLIMASMAAPHGQPLPEEGH